MCTARQGLLHFFAFCLHANQVLVQTDDWLKEHQEEVENLKAMELDALREACWMTTQARIERLSTRLEHVTTELEKRDDRQIAPRASWNE